MNISDLKKIDRCSYEEYYNQTLKHVEYTVKNYTKDEVRLFLLQFSLMISIFY